MNPLFSIVLVNYNTGKYIEKAILSVLEQDCQDFEFIVCDAGSTDNSLDVLKKYQKHFSWWVSEPDKGQSDAFNKGFSHANGEYLTWINADDLMLPGTLTAVKTAIKDTPSCKWFVPGLIYMDGQEKIFRCYKSSPKPMYVYKYASLGICPSSFFHRDIYNAAGGFNLKNHYAMDIDLWQKFLNMGYKYRRLSHWGWAFRLHVESKTSSAITAQIPPAMKAEVQRIGEENGLPEKKSALFLMRVLKCFYDYPLTYLYTRKYRGMDISAING